MATKLELERIAAAVSILHPTWHAAATRSWLATDAARPLTLRPARDVALALIACALDSDARTPAAVLRPGPWWSVVERVSDQTVGYTPGPGGAPCRRAGHEHERAGSCRACAAERLVGDDPDIDTSRPVPAPDGWRPQHLRTLTPEQRRARRLESLTIDDPREDIE